MNPPLLAVASFSEEQPVEQRDKVFAELNTLSVVYQVGSVHWCGVDLVCLSRPQPHLRTKYPRASTSSSRDLWNCRPQTLVRECAAQAPAHTFIDARTKYHSLPLHDEEEEGAAGAGAGAEAGELRCLAWPGQVLCVCVWWWGGGRTEDAGALSRSKLWGRGQLEGEARCALES